nr:hypothetical protein [Tanacetum cinerariifolium]
IPACCDDDDDYNSAITPNEPFDSLSMRDEHLNTIPATKSDEFIKSCVENLVPNPSESEGENGCDMPACFTTFSNVLFDAKYEFDSVDDQSLSDEDFSEEIFLNPLFEEEINSMRIDQHHFNAESDLIESLLNHDSSIIPSSLKIDYLLDEFTDELTLLKSIPPGIDKTDCYHENEINFIERLLYDNSSPRPPEEFVSENSNADIESFSPSPIPIEDSKSFMEETDVSFNPDDPMPSGIEEDDDDSERDILIREELHDNYSLSLPENESFRFDIPSFSRPPAKPPDGNTGILNIKMMGDISEQKLPVCYDDDDDEEGSNSLKDNINSELPSYVAITPNESVDSLSVGDEHLNTIPIKPHSFNVESDLIESMPNHDSSITISSKIDSLFDEFAGELILRRSIPPGIDETDFHPEQETRFAKRLLYDHSSPRPPEEIVTDNSNADIESFSPYPIPNKDSDSNMEEINLPFTPDDPMPPSSEDDEGYFDP